MSQIVMEDKCEECKGTGKVKVYRHDLEEFEEIECPRCLKRKVNEELSIEK